MNAQNAARLPVHQPGTYNIEAWDGDQWRGGMNRLTAERAIEAAKAFSTHDHTRYRVFGLNGRVIFDTAVADLVQKPAGLPTSVERVADQPLLSIKVGPLFTYATLDEAVALRAQLDTQIAALSEGFA